jgi:hypothetical protein
VNAADQLAALEAAIRDGANVTAVELAAARAAVDAEADLDRIRTEGEKARTRAAAALAKSQAEALDQVRADLPVEPAEVAEKHAAAIAAVDELHAAIGRWSARVREAGDTMRAGGVMPRKTFDGSDDFDPDNTWYSDAPAVIVDGVTYTASTGAVRAVAEYAARGVHMRVFSRTEAAKLAA